MLIIIPANLVTVMSKDFVNMARNAVISCQTWIKMICFLKSKLDFLLTAEDYFFWNKFLIKKHFERACYHIIIGILWICLQKPFGELYFSKSKLIFILKIVFSAGSTRLKHFSFNAIYSLKHSHVTHI